MINIVIGSDHRGFKLKEYLIKELKGKYDIKDVGCYSLDSVDYPVVSATLVQTMRTLGESTIGIIICGSGIGVDIAVNRYSDIRGALLYNREVAQTAKEHNNANVACLAADYLKNQEALEYINIFLKSTFLGGRHLRRVEMLSELK